MVDGKSFRLAEVRYAKAVIAEKAARLHIHHAADRLDGARDLQAGQDAKR
jgi:hypothetical protein